MIAWCSEALCVLTELDERFVAMTVPEPYLTDVLASVTITLPTTG